MGVQISKCYSTQTVGISHVFPPKGGGEHMGIVWLSNVVIVVIWKLWLLGMHADSYFSWMAKSHEYKKPIILVMIAINQCI